MQKFKFPLKNKEVILALGAESAGNFSVFYSGEIYLSQNFGDLLDENIFNIFKNEVFAFLKKENVKPTVIISDLHPFYVTTIWAIELAKKFKIKHTQVQHHHAHIFSQIGTNITQTKKIPLTANRQPQTVECEPSTIYGIATDGTGYGTDEKIWGGEVFEITSKPSLPVLKGRCPVLRTEGVLIQRIGHLENQILIGGDLAVREPARILISVLNKFLKKEEIYLYLKKYYAKNDFELLFNQLDQNFNCLETSSTGRILDAVSVLLGFSKNERITKHGATYLLEKNSTKPYKYPLPLIEEEMSGGQRGCYTLNTTYLFEYLLKNIHKDKKRLAATAQFYIARGLDEIIRKHLTIHNSNGCKNFKEKVILSGGLSDNKIISDYFNSQNNPTVKKDKSAIDEIPRGDAGISFGQVTYFLLRNMLRNKK